ncbi:ester cyclase [Arthrobacter sp. YAF34]|uniref:ester cyclase n=1 Tax=Arthrobacter sp. YAF34 TaxID=3233083 RepID=UPI003F8FF6B5
MRLEWFRERGSPCRRGWCPADCLVDQVSHVIPCRTVQAREGRLCGRCDNFRGNRQTPLLGIAATGGTVESGRIDIIRLQDGKIAEHWGTTDTMTLVQQIGALPA